MLAARKKFVEKERKRLRCKSASRHQSEIGAEGRQLPREPLNAATVWKGMTGERQ